MSLVPHAFRAFLMAFHNFLFRRLLGQTWTLFFKELLPWVAFFFLRTSLQQKNTAKRQTGLHAYVDMFRENTKIQNNPTTIYY